MASRFLRLLVAYGAVATVTSAVAYDHMHRNEERLHHNGNVDGASRFALSTLAIVNGVLWPIFLPVHMQMAVYAAYRKRVDSKRA